MARVTGPAFSVSASGTIGKAFTYGIWKGIQYVREWFKPFNPQTVKQVNARTALSLMMALWHTKTQEAKDKWDEYAQGQQMAGVHKFMQRGLIAYNVQLTTAVTPLSVVYVGDPPADVWTWEPVV